MRRRRRPAPPLTFEFPIRIAAGPKFYGEQVRREGPERRFVYIAIGQQAGDQGSHWSRRMKIDIHDIPPALLAEAMKGKILEGTSKGPAGTVPRLARPSPADPGASGDPLSWRAADQFADCHSSQEMSRPGKATRLRGQTLLSHLRKAPPSPSSKPSANALVRTHQNAFASKLDFSLG